MRNHDWLYQLPKAELHVHIEGTMEPEQYLLFAERNKISVPYKTVEQARSAYAFTDFASFIRTYDALTKVICTQQDFYDLVYAYLAKVATQGVLHAEIFFGIQIYAHRIHPGATIEGIHAGLVDGTRDFGITNSMIITFLRELAQDDAVEALETIRHYDHFITGVGLAAYEDGNPPAKFQQVFEKARSYDYHRVVHVEQGGAASIWQALQLLQAERIDHALGCLDDPLLIKTLKEQAIGITSCPLSNVALHFFNTLQEHPLKKMLDAGLVVSINSDDPAFFGGYVADNYRAVAESLELTPADLIACARNSFISSFASDERKKECLQALQDYVSQ